MGLGLGRGLGRGGERGGRGRAWGERESVGGEQGVGRVRGAEGGGRGAGWPGWGPTPSQAARHGR